MRSLALVLILVTCPLQADDIDIYFDAGSGPQRLVLVVDWHGVAAAGAGDALIGALGATLQEHARFLAQLSPSSDLDVSILRPPGFTCGTWPACSVGEWTLSPARSLADEGTRAALIEDLRQMAATENTVETPEFAPADYVPALAGLLSTAAGSQYCGPTRVAHLLWSDVTVPETLGAPSLAQARHFVVATSGLTGADQLAALLGTEVVALSSVEALPGHLQGELRGARQREFSLLSASVPGFVPTLPAQGEEVLFPLFRPAADWPWPGNLKALKLLMGEDGRPVIARAPLTRPAQPGLDPVDGAIDRAALTFWTNPAGADVQAFNPALGEVAGADGRSVQRGGAGQALPGRYGGLVGEANDQPGARRVYVLAEGEGTVLPPLDASEETALLLNLPTATPAELAESLTLLRWIRGEDVADEDGDENRSEPRRWLLGAIMHSQPAILDYGPRPRPGLPAGAHDRRVLVGSNDGLLRLLDISERGDPATQGVESWAALPPAMLDLQRQLLRESAGPGHRYGVDGSPVIYRHDRNGDGLYDAARGDRVWAFLTLRRGGNQLYALDLSDPDAPRLMWQVNAAVEGFAPLALGFSTPRLARLDLGEPRPRLALVFGAGYHGGWRAGVRVGKDAGGGADVLGNGLFVVDAASGELLWRAHGPPHADSALSAAIQMAVPSLQHSVPSPVTLLDSDGNGYTDRSYVADSGGNVWRLDMVEAGPGAAVSATDAIARWQLRRIAALGGSGEHDRRFFHALDVGRSRDLLGDYEAVLLISGDRAHPSETAVSNHAYLLKDRGPGVPAVSHDQLPDVTESCRDVESSSCAGLDLSRGWRLRLLAAGEKGLAAPLLRGGVAYFTTYSPEPVDVRGCRPGLGQGMLYAVRISEGAPALANLYRRERDSDSELPAPGERAVGVGEGIPGPVLPWRQYLLLPGPGVDGRKVVDPGGRMRWRSHWRENGID